MKHLVGIAACAPLMGQVLAATSGDLTVLSMNVAGLPAILQNNEVPGDKSVNSGTMGTKFAEYGYDIIHVQEVKTSDESYAGLASLT